MTGKWVMPSFMISIITMVAIACNNRFGWHLDPTQLIASISLSVNFVMVTIIGDIAKMKRGESPNLNSTKLFTLLFACLMIGFSEYVGIELDHESIWYVAGVAAAFISGKGVKDLMQNKGGGVSANTQHNITGDPRV